METAVSEQRETVLIKGQKGPHKVVDSTPGMFQVENERGDQFWIPKSKILPNVISQSKPKPQSLGAGAPIRQAAQVFVALTGSFQAFVAYMQASDYTLYVRARRDGIERAESEYRAWSGEPLPDSALYVHKKDSYSPREWLLTTSLSGDVPIPFPCIEAGTIGRGVHPEPVGLLGENGLLTVNASAIIEELIRAGLRTRRFGKDL